MNLVPVSDWFHPIQGDLQTCSSPHSKPGQGLETLAAELPNSPSLGARNKKAPPPGHTQGSAQESNRFNRSLQLDCPSA